jgi:glucokinase
MKKNIITIDVGGTKIMVQRRLNSKLDFEEKVKTPKTRRALLNQLCALIEKSLNQKSMAVSIAWAGQVDANKGIILNSPNIKGFKNFHLVDFLQKKFGLPVFVENDSRCFAFGEYLALKKPCRVFVGITFGTGVGGGVVIGGEILHGALFQAGEFGHMIFHGKTVEQHFAGSALNQAIEQFRSDLKSLGKEKFWHEVLANLSELLYNVMIFYDAEKIVIGGGFGRDVYAKFENEINQNLELLNKKNKKFIDFKPRKRRVVEFSKMNDSTNFGCLMIALKKLNTVR